LGSVEGGKNLAFTSILMYNYMYVIRSFSEVQAMGIKHALSIVEAREQLTRLPEMFDQELEEQHQVSAVAVTRHNKPVLAILPWELYESIVETLEILGDEELMADLRLGLKEALEGKGETLEDVKKELGL
jgi:antitoxin YefM